MISEYRIKYKLMNEEQLYYESTIFESKKENQSLRDELSRTEANLFSARTNE